MTGHLQVIQPGRTAVTDLGRARGPVFGMPVNGALDQHAARVANALVGNRPDAPLLEGTAFDFSASPTVDTLIAVTGADARVTIDGHPAEQWAPVVVGAGQRLAVTQITRGVRVYVALFGSFEAERLLDSCAPDTVLGFGTHLHAGAGLPLLRALPRLTQPALGVALFRFDAPRVESTGTLSVDVVDGPDRAEFGASAERLFTSSFRVGPASNHVGLRFEGVAPQRATAHELLSRGVPVGAVEVPAGDEVLVLHRGRGVTAGYPVLGVVTQPGLDALAQARPGDSVRFRHTTIQQATTQERARRASVDELSRRVRVAYDALGLDERATGDRRWSALATPLPI